MSYRYLGYGVTNENGVAKLEYNSEGQKRDHSYTGVGAGEVDVVASLDNPVSSGSIVSGTYEVLDCLVYDDGISDPKKTTFIKSANGTVTIGSDGTTFKSSSNATYRNTTLITGDFEIVFQASLTGSVRIGVQTGSNLGYQQSKFNYYDVSDYYFKLKRVGSTITAQYSTDGVNWNNRSLETDNVADNDCYFLFSIETTGTERTIIYKDLKIYPI